MSVINKKRVAILGAGISGLVSIKQCLEEGLEPVCFEQHDQIGGVWYYTDKTRPNQGATIYPTLITNSSKEMMAFSDYPMPTEYPPYLPHDLFNKYLHDYVEHFGLMKYIEFNSEIVRLEKADDHHVTGNWVIHVKRHHADIIDRYTFPYVMVATGVFRNAYIPDTPGLEQFQGKKIHSQDFRHADEFRNQRVLVIGNANSAGDVAAEVSHEAAMVYMSVGHGTWVIPRMANNGVPRDLFFKRSLYKLAPEWLLNKLIKKHLMERMDHGKYGLLSPKDPTYSPVMLNDEVGWRIIGGKIEAKPYVVKYTTQGATFEDESRLDNIDAIIFATGYKLDFTFMEKGLIEETEEDLELYKFVWPVNSQHHTLAMIGCASTTGAHPPIYELQARWVTRVFTGQNSLPGEVHMRNDVKRAKADVIKRFGHFKLGVQNLPYRDELAEEIGVKPDFWEQLLIDPKLAFACYFGAALPFQYRLKGPHPWKAAERANNEAYDNYFATTRKGIERKTDESFLPLVLKSLLVITLIISVFIKFNLIL